MKARVTRKLNGVLLLNKCTGDSSNRVLQQVKRLYQASKAGHTGSLDPLASGVLPICFGEATKFAQFLLDADKTYKVTAQLGVITASGDAEGEILATNVVPEFTAEYIQQTIATFLGHGKQIPSMYSALKHNGQPLYKLARQGVTIDRPARDIIIYDYNLLAHNGDKIDFEVKCSKGTYIRSLIEDLGAKLGCGAHVAKLERTQAGKFMIDNSYSIEQLQNTENIDELLLPIDCLIDNLPKVILNATDADYVSHGRVVRAPEGTLLGTVSLFAPDQAFLGIGEATNEGNIAPRRIVSIV